MTYYDFFLMVAPIWLGGVCLGYSLGWHVAARVRPSLGPDRD